MSAHEGDTGKQGRDTLETLQLVDDLLSEIQGADVLGPSENKRLGQVLEQLQTEMPGLAVLPRILLQVYGELVGITTGLNEARRLMQRAAVDRLHNTNMKLLEVSTTTENAATSMLDGLDKALLLVDQLENNGGAGANGISDTTAREHLREELHGLMGLLQFQDITTQQISHVSAVLSDLEERLRAMLRLFNPAFAPHEGATEAATEDEDYCGSGVSAAARTYDPAASTENAEGRQAMVDEIFTSNGSAEPTD